MSLFLDFFFKKKSARKHGLGLIFSFIFYQEKIKKVISELYFLTMGDPGSKTGKKRINKMHYTPIVDINPDKEVQASEASAYIEPLHLSYIEISDLAAIEYFLQVSEFYCL